MQSQREILAGTELYIHRRMEEYTEHHRTDQEEERNGTRSAGKEEEKEQKKSPESHDSKGNEVRRMKLGWVLWYGMIRYSTVRYSGITRNYW